MAARFRFFGSLLVVATLSGSAIAYANEPTEASREQARGLAARGYEALQRKQYALAEDLFRRADLLVHAPTIVVDHARALVGLGRLVEAHERYELVMREGIPTNVPWSWQRAAADAERELAELKPRLAWLTIRVSGPSKPTVEVDDREVPSAALGVRRATDPGTHTVKLRASGYGSKEQTVTLGEGEVKELRVTLELEGDVLQHSELEEQHPEERAHISEAYPTAPNNTLAFVMLGIGGAGLVTGAVTGSMALGVRSKLNEDCVAGVCHPQLDSEAKRYRKDIDRYRLLGTVSGVSFGAGVAAAATGGVLLWLGSRNHEKRTESFGFRAAPYLTADEVGVAGHF